MEKETVWLVLPGIGEPKEVEATPSVLVTLMVQGWRQCPAPQVEKQEVTERVG